MVTFILIGALVASVIFNVVQRVRIMRLSAKGRAALEAIATLANYTQDSLVSSEDLAEAKKKISAEALKMVAQQLFIAKGISSAITKDLKKLWAKGLAKIKTII